MRWHQTKERGDNFLWFISFPFGEQNDLDFMELPRTNVMNILQHCYANLKYVEPSGLILGYV